MTEGRITEDRHGRKAPAVPTLLGIGFTLAVAARHRVPVARWTGGPRHRIYVDGIEVEDWSPWR